MFKDGYPIYVFPGYSTTEMRNIDAIMVGNPVSKVALTTNISKEATSLLKTCSSRVGGMNLFGWKITSKEINERRARKQTGSKIKKKRLRLTKLLIKCESFPIWIKKNCY
nr:BAF_HP1_G0046910.mRNA.1.CDS.1 [Saccharomyces cerevisiae]